MNKTLIFAAVAAFTCALAFGQSPVVSLQNQEDSTFYYVVDPQELAGLSAGSPLLASKVAGYFSAASTGATFSVLAPQAEVQLTGLTEGTHLLVGFFAQLDADDFPVRVVALQVDSSVGERFYAVFASPAQLSVRRGVGKLAQFARTAASQVATVASSEGTAPAVPIQPAQGTLSLPAIATFSSAYDPKVFTRESNSSFNVLPISESHAWTQTGTRIASLQGNLDSAGLTLALNVPGGFSPSVSYFLYFFDARAPGRENPLTLEIEPVARSDRGACILWQKSSAPRLIGTVKTSGSSVELEVGADELASGVLAAAGNSPTVDLTAGWYDKALGIWEEFYYTTFTPPSMSATH